MTEIHVTGMTCGGCVNSVRRAVERVLPQVKSEIELGSGKLRFDVPAQDVRDSVAKVVAAIEAAGFGAEVTTP
jgi:copper chaperone